LISLSVNIGQKNEKSTLWSERSSHTFCARMRPASRIGRHDVHRIGTSDVATRRSMYTRETMRHSDGKRAHSYT
jgi:hypothetical protein